VTGVRPAGTSGAAEAAEGHPAFKHRDWLICSLPCTRVSPEKSRPALLTGEKAGCPFACVSRQRLKRFGFAERKKMARNSNRITFMFLTGIITALVLPALIVAVLFVALLKPNPVRSRTSFGSKEITALESAFYISLPTNSCQIERSSILHGKDSTLYAKVSVLPEHVTTLKRNSRIKFNRMKSDDIVKGDFAISWFKIDPAHLDEVWKADDGTTLVFTVPIAGKVYLFMRTSSARRRLPSEVYEMFY